MVEKLTEIRTRRQRGRRRRRHHSLSYAQLRVFIGDKAEAAGAISVAIEPWHTSRRWTRCGHVRRRNLPTQSTFGRGRADTRLAPTSTRAAVWGGSILPGRHVCRWRTVHQPACRRSAMPASLYSRATTFSWSRAYQVLNGPPENCFREPHRATTLAMRQACSRLQTHARIRHRKKKRQGRATAKPVAAQSIPQFSPPIPLQVMPGRCDGETVGRPRERARPAQAFH